MRRKADLDHQLRTAKKLHEQEFMWNLDFGFAMEQDFEGGQLNMYVDIDIHAVQETEIDIDIEVVDTGTDVDIDTGIDISIHLFVFICVYRY